jgi:hypothetical protein
VRSTRTVPYAVALGTLLLAVGSLSACTAPGEDARAGADSTLRSAVAATRAAGTARIVTTSSVEFPGTTESTTTAGVQSLDGTRAQVTARLPQGRVGSTVVYDVPMVVVGPTVWFSFPAPSFPEKRLWGTAQVATARQPADMTLPAVWRVGDWLSSLEKVAYAHDAGTSVVDGATTHRITARMPSDADSLGASLGGFVGGTSHADADTVRIDVVLDPQGRVVRMTQTWDERAGTGVVVTEKVDVELADFGTAVAPVPPKGPISPLTAGQMFVIADHK